MTQYSNEIQSTMRLCAALMDEINNLYIFDRNAANKEPRKKKIYKICVDLQQRAGDLANAIRKESETI